ncbi:hypothetical protein DXG01_014353 [Tephrocybe rancida]|nr:hypothetical protein DXG01_014353 [Tephrocybe rancida]
MPLAQGTITLELVQADVDFLFEDAVSRCIQDGFGLNDPFSPSPLLSASSSPAASPVPSSAVSLFSSPISSAPTSRGQEQRKASAVKDAGRWEFGLSLFSKMEELRSLGGAVGGDSSLPALLR